MAPAAAEWENDDSEGNDIAQTLNRAGGINDTSGDTLCRLAHEIAQDIAKDGSMPQAPAVSAVVRRQPQTTPLIREWQEDDALLLHEASKAREQLALISQASARIGTTVDLWRTAEELIKVVTPRFADFVTVDLLDSVLRGDEPDLPAEDRPIVLRAVAVGEEDGGGLTTVADSVGALSRFDAAKVYAQCLRTGQALLVSEVNEETLGRIVTSPERVRAGLEAGIHSYLMVPVQTRGTVLGGIEFIRTLNPEGFTAADVRLAEELVARAAISIDIARLYLREQKTAST